jgi:hypothetical protein
MPDTFTVNISVKGTNVAIWFWREYPTLVARCTTPTFRQKKIAECSKRYDLNGTITLNELRLLPNDIEMIGSAFTGMRFEPSHD